MITAFEQSGQSMHDFCLQHQMPVSSFSSLLRRHAGKHSSAAALLATERSTPGTAAFLPVEIVADRRVVAVAAKRERNSETCHFRVASQHFKPINREPM